MMSVASTESECNGFGDHDDVFTGKDTELAGEYRDTSSEYRASTPPETGRVGGYSASPLRQKCVKLHNFASGTQSVDALHHNATTCEAPCSDRRCRGSILAPSNRTGSLPRPTTEVLKQATEFIEQYYVHINRANTDAHATRLAEVTACIETTGTYRLTEAELSYGAKLAWRNAPRCIGRIQWSKLQLFDARNVRNTRGMLEAVCKHLLYATNKGNIRSAITVFPPRTDGQHDYRVWNTTLIKYAGYEQEDGTIIGDPASVEFTKICLKLGWRGPGGRFDILPLILQANGEDPEWFDIPEECAMEVKLSHPEFDWFAEFGLRWYAVPAVSNMMLDVGGLEFTACPFNGWYMSTEIGARNLCDTYRYNLMETTATKMGLDTTSNMTLWKDKALVETNLAVLHSFQKAQVTITDHHSASESFITHMRNEQATRGGCPADWVWIVPPMSGSVCPVFHQEMLYYSLKPSYEYQEPAWKTHLWRNRPVDSGQVTSKKTFKEVAEAVRFVARLMIRALSKRFKATILYATETGRSKNYAERIHRMFSTAFNAKLLCMDEYDVANLEHEALLLVVASTFGNGDPPDNGLSFARYIMEKAKEEQRKMDSIVRRNSEIDCESTSEHLSCEKFCDQPVRIAPRKILRMNSVTSMDEPTYMLSNVRYAVFGLGSSAYPNFCAFGHAVDELLETLGAERLLEIGEGDELGGQEIAFKKWAQETFKVACENFCIGSDVNIDNVTASISMPDAAWSAEKYRVIAADYQANPPDLCRTLSRLHGKAVLPCRFKSRTDLLNSLSRRSTILVKLDTQDQEEFAYEPGDHVAIYPANDKDLVDRILRRIAHEKSPDVVVKVDRHEAKITELGTVRTWVPHDRLPHCSIRYALLHLLDITSTPSPMFLKTLSMHARSPLEQKQLSTLGEGSAVYDEWLYSSFPNLAEILEAFPTLRVPASLLLTLLPLLRPRYYSISSSPQMHPGDVHITVAVVQYKSKASGAIHRGVCSTWLDALSADDIVPAFIRKAPSFHMPKDQSAPMVLVGPGTGIAPFRSFWQQRQYDRYQEAIDQSDADKDGRFGDVTLVFGCRHSKLDNIYKEEKMTAKEEGVLTDVWTAYSREVHLPKTYVQDLLRKNSQKVYETVCGGKGHVYVCGDVTMAAGVRVTIETIIAKHGEMSEEKAKKLIERLKDENRYHEDIFGITLRTAEATEKLRELKQRTEKNDKTAAEELASLRMGYFLRRETVIRHRTVSENPETSVNGSNLNNNGRERKLSDPPPYRSRPLHTY
ncbi:nitric oxide synthase-like protein isoform X2 [Patiria miniata]|uniref:Nitric oxide synthase n=1 Tax=Patiria miniata TaxID=46514 RepID=A0A914A5X2_PATMI|nr:nitric oxide synthase-like protein isoform X2 [Patiria miniata]